MTSYINNFFSFIWQLYFDRDQTDIIYSLYRNKHVLMDAVSMENEYLHNY